ncbi:TonB-denpendent receptor [Sulfurifustis variabilis]|uniref:TonB-denpendent receptor n=1 Tax=Sulfurifustis variabilis TaxID=1675686 RepID=A0A1B4V117_9GAMM|nr:TonB-dependent receptor [Sulfurifustis variabilis]BAU47169.1 TonB-denpendent receptor [Sulfurifustis variabilis]
MALPPSGRGPGIAARLLLACLAPLLPALAAGQSLDLDIRRLTLEELMDIDVYSVSRKLERVRGTAAAVYVLTSEDIRRSRATSLPEALRLVPGVQVARLDANKYAIGIRGMNARTSNKLLVMIDGRTIYDPLFSGVLWEARDVMLEDVERIEVIRGPGGTLWGSNAVNGVINVITRSARDTQGGLVAVGAGTEERAFGAARYGWKPGERSAARVYAQGNRRDESFASTGEAFDDSQRRRGGFRVDWEPTGRDRLRFSGDVYRATAGEALPAPVDSQDVEHQGGNIVAAWTRSLGEGSELRLRFYYDRAEIDNLYLGEERDTLDFETQHRFRMSPRQELTWGVGHRQSRDDIRSSSAIAIAPAERTLQWTNVYAQDAVALVPGRWRLVLGTKVEENEYTGAEWQPSVRIAHTPDDKRTYWASVSRAVRTPSRFEADQVAGTVRIGENFGVEKLVAYEAGYRAQPDRFWSWDVAFFYNVYDELLTLEPSGLLANGMQGETYGLELTGRWQVRPDVRLEAIYGYLGQDLELEEGSGATTWPARTERLNPKHAFSLHGAFDIARNVEIDATLRFVDELPGIEVPGFTGDIAAYTELDLGVGWHARRDLELSLVGQNLLDPHHPEHSLATEVQRGVYGKVTWRF